MSIELIATGLPAGGAAPITTLTSELPELPLAIIGEYWEGESKIKGIADTSGIFINSVLTLPVAEPVLELPLVLVTSKTKNEIELNQPVGPGIKGNWNIEKNSKDIISPTKEQWGLRVGSKLLTAGQFASGTVVSLPTPPVVKAACKTTIGSKYITNVTGSLLEIYFNSKIKGSGPEAGSVVKAVFPSESKIEMSAVALETNNNTTLEFEQNIGYRIVIKEGLKVESGSKFIENVVNQTKLLVGMPIRGTGMEKASTIKALIPGENKIEMNVNSKSTAENVRLEFEAYWVGTLSKEATATVTPGELWFHEFNNGVISIEPSLPVKESAPSGLQEEPGQFRILVGTQNARGEVIGGEYMRVHQAQNELFWIVERGAEVSNRLAHPKGSQVWHVLTAEAIKAFIPSEKNPFGPKFVTRCEPDLRNFEGGKKGVAHVTSLGIACTSQALFIGDGVTKTVPINHNIGRTWVSMTIWNRYGLVPIGLTLEYPRFFDGTGAIGTKVLKAKSAGFEIRDEEESAGFPYGYAIFETPVKVSGVEIKEARIKKYISPTEVELELAAGWEANYTEIHFTIKRRNPTWNYASHGSLAKRGEPGCIEWVEQLQATGVTIFWETAPAFGEQWEFIFVG